MLYVFFLEASTIAKSDSCSTILNSLDSQFSN